MACRQGPTCPVLNPPATLAHGRRLFADCCGNPNSFGCLVRRLVNHSLCWAIALLALGFGCSKADGQPPVAVQRAELDDVDAGFAEPDLETSRMVRRIQLSLLGRPPTIAELDAIENKDTAEAQQAALAELIEGDLNSVEFYRESMRFAHDWFRVGAHNVNANISHNYFTGHLAIELHLCPATSLHAGSLGLFNNYPEYGDPRSTCDDPAAKKNMVQPWWAPDTTVSVLGRAGSATPQDAVRKDGLYDCGVANVGDRSNLPSDRTPNPTCGCGPNRARGLKTLAFQPPGAVRAAKWPSRLRH